MFLYDATGHVGIGSKFNEQGPPAERLDVDGNTKLKGKLFFERPASNGAYAAASGNALVVPDGEAESLVVRATGGTTFLTLDSSDQRAQPLAFLRGLVEQDSPPQRHCERSRLGHLHGVPARHCADL